MLLGIAAISAVGAELSTPTYSYLTTTTYNGQKRDPASWGTIKTSSLTSTLYPLCASSNQQSPISLSQFTSGASSSVSSKLAPLYEAIDASWPTDATLTGLYLTTPEHHAEVTALYNQKMVTSCTWWCDGAELRLKGFNKKLQFVDPAHIYPSSIPVAYRTKTLESINFVVGSAHTIGGERRDLEIQYVYVVDPAVETEASNSGVATTTIVSVTATAGMYTSNTLLGTLLSHLSFTALVPATTPPAAASTSTMSETAGIDLMKFLPASTSYFTYEGSETSPPCRRARWFVYKEAIPVAMHQIAFIREKLGLALSTSDAAPSTYTTLRGNYRPLQELLAATAVGYFEDVNVESQHAHQRDGNGPNYDELLRQSVVSILLAIAACAISGGAAYVNWSRRVISADDDDDDGSHVDKAKSNSAEKKASLKNTLAAQHSSMLGKASSNAQLRTTTSDLSDDESHDDD